MKPEPDSFRHRHTEFKKGDIVAVTWWDTLVFIAVEVKAPENLKIEDITPLRSYGRVEKVIRGANGSFLVIAERHPVGGDDGNRTSDIVLIPWAAITSVEVIGFDGEISVTVVGARGRAGRKGT